MVDREAGNEVVLATIELDYRDPRWVVASAVLARSDWIGSSLLRYVGLLWRGTRSTTCRSSRSFRRRR